MDHASSATYPDPTVEIERLEALLERERREFAEQVEHLTEEQDRFIARLLQREAREVTRSASLPPDAERVRAELREELDTVHTELNRARRALSRALVDLDEQRETNRKLRAELDAVARDSASRARLEVELEAAKLILDSALELGAKTPAEPANDSHPRSLRVSRSGTGPRPIIEINEVAFKNASGGYR